MTSKVTSIQLCLCLSFLFFVHSSNDFEGYIYSALSLSFFSFFPPPAAAASASAFSLASWACTRDFRPFSSWISAIVRFTRMNSTSGEMSITILHLCPHGGNSHFIPMTIFFFSVRLLWSRFCDQVLGWQKQHSNMLLQHSAQPLPPNWQSEPLYCTCFFDLIVIFVLKLICFIDLISIGKKLFVCVNEASTE